MAKSKIFKEARERYWASLYLDISLVFRGLNLHRAQSEFRRALYQYIPMNKRDEVLWRVRSFIEEQEKLSKGGG